MTTLAIDAPACYPGEKLRDHVELGCPGRCRHDMLHEQCAWCKGLPDVPNFDSFQLIDDEPTSLRWVAAEHRDECAGCAAVIEKREPIAYSPEHQGWIGRCCGETT